MSWGGEGGGGVRVNGSCNGYAGRNDMLCEFKLPIVVMESVVWMWPWGFLRVIIRLSQSYY